jgi:hypothetical protein
MIAKISFARDLICHRVADPSGPIQYAIIVRFPLGNRSGVASEFYRPKP